MVLEEEEETTRLLSESVTSSPTKQTNVLEQAYMLKSQRQGNQHQIKPVSSDNELNPRFGWQRSPNKDQQLLLGQAEKTFLAMSGVLPTSSNRTSKSDSLSSYDNCDTNVQVPDSLQVVKNILSELEADDDSFSETSVDTKLLNCNPKCVTSKEIENNFRVECDNCSECFCDNQFLDLSKYPGTRGSLVVDVHQEVPVQEVENRCSKHTAERFPRCYSESHRQRHKQNAINPPINLDKIETVGDDRLRHFSESAVGAGRRKRAATFSRELKQLRKSMTLVQSQNLNVKDEDVESSPMCVSTESFLSDVKFDIWDEQENEQSFDIKEEKREELDEYDFEKHIEYKQHPLFTNLRDGMYIPVSMSHSSSTNSMPICRICQLPSIEQTNPLISPCRCLGSIRYVHNPCLMKWLEVCSKKNSDLPGCELCQYQYIRHKKFVISNWMVPSCSSKDKVLHSVFMAAIATMITCSIVTILCFKQNGDIKSRVGPNTELSASELMTLSCGVLFFLSFFVAMYVEVKAENTIYQLICKFLYMNHEWTIEEYDRRRDPAKQVDLP